MFMKAKSIVGLPVLTVEDGNNEETCVTDVVYDSITNEVKALLVDDRGWFIGAKIVMLEDINSIGLDEVVIDSEELIIESDYKNQEVTTSLTDDSNFLTKNEVITQGGNILGRVTDIYFDFPTGAIDAVEVTEDLFQRYGPKCKKIFLSDVITMGENTLIVKNTAQDILDNPFDTNGHGYTGKSNNNLSQLSAKKLSVLDSPGKIHFPPTRSNVYVTEENLDERLQVVQIKRRK